MRNLVYLTPLAALGLAGCVVGPSLAQRMSGYVGRPEAVLVAQLGVPDRRIRVDGITYFAYVRKSVDYSSGGSFGYGGFGYGGFGYGGFGPFGGSGFGGFYGPFYGGGYPSDAYTSDCTTTFELKGKVVQSFTLRGNDC